MSKKILYVGIERCDFVYYLSAVLSLKGSVLVADNSLSGDLFLSVCKKKDENVAEWRNVTCARNLDVQASDTSAYDYIITYAGFAIDKEDFEADTLALIMPDYTDLSLSRLEECLPAMIAHPLYVLRDYCTKKVTDKSIAQRLYISPSDIAGHIELSTTDIQAYIALTHNGRHSIKGASETMVEAITYVVAHIFETTQKVAVKLVADARKIK